MKNCSKLTLDIRWIKAVSLIKSPLFGEYVEQKYTAIMKPETLLNT